MGFLKFLWRHPVAAIFATIGFCLTVGGMLSDAYSFFQLGLPPMALAALGAAVFMGSIITMLYKWEAQLRQPAMLSRPSNQPFHSSAAKGFASITFGFSKPFLHYEYRTSVVIAGNEHRDQVTVFGRVARPVSHLNGAEWKWSETRRLEGDRSLFPGETIQHDDVLQICTEGVAIFDYFEADIQAGPNGNFLMVEISVAAASDKVLARQIYNIRLIEGTLLLDLVSPENVAGIQDNNKLGFHND